MFATTSDRKRQVEFIAFLDHLVREIDPGITTIHLVLNIVSAHKGKKVQYLLATRPHFQMQFTPVHCSWINPVDQWFSILQRKRLLIAVFADKKQLQERLMALVTEWN